MVHALIVDDDVNTREALFQIVSAEGFVTSLAGSIRDAQIQIGRQRPDLVLIDLRLPDGNGIDLFNDIKLRDSTEIVLITGYASVETAIDALRLGATDYLTKPINFRRLKGLLSRVPRAMDFCDDGGAAVNPLADRHSPGPMSGNSSAMQQLQDQIARVARTDVPVLLLGESGTGKELAAHAIHDQSRRRNHPCMPVNCGAISPQLIESEIFGHEKGSFTGADRQHKGYFERASGGTLFLDEITEMSPDLQVKLLRVLENGSFMRIGSTQEIETDVRLVAATNREPEEAIAAGKLRLDLYHRLNVFPLRLPPLRARDDDVILLAQEFLGDLNDLHGTNRIFSRDALAGLKKYHWPGNVRELRNCVQRAFILSDERIDTVAPSDSLAANPLTGPTLAVSVGMSLAEVDRQYIFATLALCGGVKKHAAEMLGISLKTLYNRLEGYGHEERIGAAPPPSRPIVLRP
ncbi:two-component system response regulator AtoC [Actimicrobium sp. GrIS 1.19]|uniref:sigma-54-dependent transcriptional regulator n=1 Tax=Actimicrobium sp. GrIS 1.19 TaxID=3071708 RepID=UPI002E089013|nr:two-component system response regulator AtoC [Actimicrobium sp. GrIS 1.19]